MATVSHERQPLDGRPGRSLIAMPREAWPSLAIAVMWLVVLFDALFGPDIETSNGSGTNTSSVPSAVVVALFVLIANWIVAHYAYRDRRA